ncbi:TKL family protein kinase [Histomonas meleagridis]|uniref:TKL family protein kinase n=1 Tax=Histomonas meleagridis TaxID=135588 RepID=UPI00355A961C|nr:TKL family protein kinase [Histomonas meleagridis]KAH0804136.1 TKL family protein kinase [Histomonas meleagridis]
MNQNSYEGKIMGILEKIENIEKKQFSAYIHCSKINSCLFVLKKITPIIRECLTRPNQPKMNSTINKAVVSVISVLDQFQELFNQCTRESCLTFILPTDVSAPKMEIKALRDAAVSAFNQLELPQVAQCFKISEQELNSQDMVDMKRLGQILIQVSLKNREDTAAQLAARFNSLKKLGIEISREDATDVPIPELPPKLNLVINRDDVQINKRIGKGQSGFVNLGVYLPTQEVVAVKILHQRALKQPELESFRREIYTLATLNHYALLRFVGYTEDSPFLIVTEYMQNGSLFDVLRKNPTALTPTIRSLIAYDVAQGMKYLHERNIIHRDLKSLNVLLDDKYHAKICDFGMVRTHKDGPMTGLIGTAHWMAPEVLMSKPSYDEKVDVYSYGIFLWELLTGGMPYQNMKPAEITLGVVGGTLRPPIPADSPPSLSRLIQKCWSQQPEDRPTMARIVTLLVNPKYHFAGTDEEQFSHEIKQTKHKTTHKKHRHAKGATPSNKDITNLINKLGKCQTSESRNSISKLLGESLTDKKSAKLIASNGGCTIITQILTEDSNEQTKEHLIKCLKRCNSPEIFDVNVLKALLTYSSNNNQKLRRSALTVLISASLIRFDFICSAPAFILQLLSFLRKPEPTKLIISLLDLIRKLLDNIQNIPEGIIGILIWARNNLDQKLKADIDQTIVSTLNFTSAKVEVTKEDWRQLIKEFNESSMILSKYCEGNQSLHSDPMFISLLFAEHENTQIVEFMGEIVNNPRFAGLIVQNLPINNDTITVTNVYVHLLDYQQFYQQLSKIPEFYAVASYLIASHQVELVCSALKVMDLQPNILKKSKLCVLLAEELTKATNEIDVISLMAAIFSVSKVINVPEFTRIIRNLFGFLFSENTSFRMPAFLCIASIGKNAPEAVNYIQLMPTAAFYICSESNIMKEYALIVIKDHINDNGIDIIKVLMVFVDAYKVPDKMSMMAARAIANVIQQRRKKGIDPEYQKRFTQILGN